ncbi:HHR129Wp [Eremothecium sinecaudum]|uniref:Glutathione hydrolase n=1 Tax=Eremothecium sinecaudum TaxID=45286 RepID=A0A0X8HWW6_9SACH|nr:HHR129Wp [Eremothecium sinecaudum]AMD22898.1 HHR129Wp [Eremothecium sinecaudum]
MFLFVRKGSGGTAYHSMSLTKMILPLALILSRFCAFCAGKAHLQSHTSVLDHGIEIGPLNRTASITPELQHLKVGQNGAISSDLELCNRMGVHDILLGIPGSNAADAAITVALCIGMVNFFNSGIGGGGYAVYVDGEKSERNLAFDFRETAPELAHKNMFSKDPKSSKYGGLSVAVPGELAGLYELYKRRGSGVAKWSQLLLPVVELGRGGWSVGTALGASLKKYESYFKEHKQDWAFVLHPDENRVLDVGEWITRPALANTLEVVARSGNASVFYDPSSELVRSMVNTIQSTNGIITEADFAKYKVEISAPLSTKIRRGLKHLPNNDLTVYTIGGSSSGAALLSALKIMDHFDGADGGDSSPEQLYLLVESMKWMASARSRLGDINGGSKSSPQVRDILGQNWIKYAVSLIKGGRDGDTFSTMANWTDYLPAYEPNTPGGTTHISIVDYNGNAVSLTATVNLLFGSLVHDSSTGIVFNNEMDDFSQPGKSNTFGISPSIYNFPEPHKRPLSSTAPTIICNELGLPDMIIGAAGGSRIVTAILQTIIRSYWYNMPLLQAISFPRIHHQLLPEQLEIESFSMLGDQAIQSLRSMGHKTLETSPHSVVNGIRSWHGQWHAVSDYWRKRGVSVAY